MTDPLHALSPLDGRYLEAVAPLRDFFSEFAFLRLRLRIELDFLRALAKIGLVRPLTDSESAHLDRLIADLSPADAAAIQVIERRIRHDVKAIEYFLRDKLSDSSLKDLLPWLHFGLTSEDVNNLALAIALRQARNAVLLPALDELLATLRTLAWQTRAVPMLARTHGQPAVPTTFGKELAVFLVRLKTLRHDLAAFRFQAKLTGAVGNFNALQAAAPHIDWPAFSRAFIAGYDLEPNLFTTQILPYDNWLRCFDLLRLTNAILLDLVQDLWRYISDGLIRQALIESEVGSSTMPHKVNPIDFENAEGNLGLANALFLHYAQKLPISRLQRDLSDSTVRRTFGVALGHTLLAWTACVRGLNRIAPNEDALRAELNAHWEVVTEGAQTILRSIGREDAYEQLKQQTRGRILRQDNYRAWCETLDVDETTRRRLLNLSPETYLGKAIELTEQACL